MVKETITELFERKSKVNNFFEFVLMIQRDQANIIESNYRSNKI